MIVGGSRRLRDRLCSSRERRFYLFINRPTDFWSSSAPEQVTKHIPTNHVDLPLAIFQRGEFVCPWSAETKKDVFAVGKMIWNKLRRDLTKPASFLGMKDTTAALSSVPVDISAIKQRMSSTATWVSNFLLGTPIFIWIFISSPMSLFHILAWSRYMLVQNSEFGCFNGSSRQ